MRSIFTLVFILMAVLMANSKEQPADFQKQNHYQSGLIVYSQNGKVEPVGSEKTNGRGGVQPENVLGIAYPNPAKGDHVFIPIELETGQIGIFILSDILGNSIEQMIVTGGAQTLKIPVGHLKRGVYFYNFQVEGKRVQSKRLILE